MSEFATIAALAAHLRQELGKKKYLLLFAYNGTGKTRLSMEFKEIGKNRPATNLAAEDGNLIVTEYGDAISVENTADTLYFNAFTEDLFNWDNDLDGDEIRELRLNTKSRFFDKIFDIDIANRIRPFLGRYADFNFDVLKKEIKLKVEENEYTEEITYISFEREVLVGDKLERIQNIKISRGEENTFIWCFFLAICELVIDQDESYNWVKYIYIDDPISSLDDNNSILIACDLVSLIKRQETNHEAKKIKVVISTHHSLFFNVICNEFGRIAQRYLFYKERDGVKYILHHDGEDTPFAYHVSVLSELKVAQATGNIKLHHFGMLRAVLEKTSVFFGYKAASDCLPKDEDKAVYARFLNLFSHGKASLYEFREPNEDHKEIFIKILNIFMNQYKFKIPTLIQSQETQA